MCRPGAGDLRPVGECQPRLGPGAKPHLPRIFDPGRRLQQLGLGVEGSGEKEEAGGGDKDRLPDAALAQQDLRGAGVGRCARGRVGWGGGQGGARRAQEGCCRALSMTSGRVLPGSQAEGHLAHTATGPQPRQGPGSCKGPCKPPRGNRLAVWSPWPSAAHVGAHSFSACCRCAGGRAAGGSSAPARSAVPHTRRRLSIGSDLCSAGRAPAAWLLGGAIRQAKRCVPPPSTGSHAVRSLHLKRPCDEIGAGGGSVSVAPPEPILLLRKLQVNQWAAVEMPCESRPGAGLPLRCQLAPGLHTHLFRHCYI